MKKYQFIVLSGLVTAFSVVSIYDRWQMHELLENQKASLSSSEGQQESMIEKSVNFVNSKILSPQEQDQKNKEKLISLSKLYIALSELSQWYYLRNEPKATEHEVYVFKNAVFAKIEQEKLWKEHFSWDREHQVISDKNKKPGMMKRFDFIDLNDRTSWLFVQKFIDGMEGYYYHWRKAVFSACVPKGDVVARARSAFSSYQGGEDQACRWSDSYQLSAKIDVDFFKNFKQKSWRKYSVVIPNKKIEKIADKKIKVPEKSILIKSGDLVRLPNENVCLFKNDKLQCVKQASDLVCLNSITKLDDEKIDITVKWNEIKEYDRKILNRFETCESFNPELRAISSLIKTKRKIKLRKTPGGKFLTVVPKGIILKVEDYQLESQKQKHTYYKVSFDGKKGFIYGGTEKTTDRWIGSVNFKRKKKTSNEMAKLIEKFKSFLQL